MSDLTDIFPPLRALPYRDPEVARLHALFIEHMLTARQAQITAQSMENLMAAGHRASVTSGLDHVRAKASQVQLEERARETASQARATCAQLVEAVRLHTPPDPRPKLEAWLTRADAFARGGEA